MTPPTAARTRAAALLLALAGLAAAPAAAQDRAADALVVRGRVHVGDGRVIEDGAVLTRGGSIVRVGPWEGFDAPEGVRVVAPPRAEVTPGLVDAAVTGGGDYAEHETEVTPHLSVLDALSLGSEGWERLAARGVTTVYVTADPGAVIGGRGALLKTGRIPRVLDADGAVKATIGREAWVRGARNRRPSRRGAGFRARRPNTRMGLVWVFRDAFAGAATGELEGPAGPVLREVLSGERALRIQARRANDIETALRLTAEVGLRSFVLEEGTEVARTELARLRDRGVAVVFGPIFERPRGFRARTGEADEPALETPVALADARVTFCLTASDRTGEAALPTQAMLAIRYGLDPASALAAVTATPAGVLGVADRLGTLAAGLDADLVVWSGPPFEATTRPLLVLIDGAPAAGELPPADADGKERF